MVPQHLALVSETDFVTLDDLADVAAAVQKQVMTDFGPAWGVTASVAAFAELKRIPSDYCPIVVRDALDVAALGAHRDALGQPFALVLFKEHEWPATVSHEALEMLADPTLSASVAGPGLADGQVTVKYLMEVCDPCQQVTYKVNGIPLSDFITPRYFDAPDQPGAFSFTGKVTAPREVLLGGYLTWLDPATDTWSQLHVTAKGREFRDLAPGEVVPDISLRGSVDRATARYLGKKRRRAARKAVAWTPAAPAAHAARWRKLIDDLVKLRS